MRRDGDFFFYRFFFYYLRLGSYMTRDSAVRAELVPRFIFWQVSLSGFCTEMCAFYMQAKYEGVYIARRYVMCE